MNVLTRDQLRAIVDDTIKVDVPRGFMGRHHRKIDRWVEAASAFVFGTFSLDGPYSDHTDPTRNCPIRQIFGGTDPGNGNWRRFDTEMFARFGQNYADDRVVYINPQ